MEEGAGGIQGADGSGCGVNADVLASMWTVEWNSDGVGESSAVT